MFYRVIPFLIFLLDADDKLGDKRGEKCNAFKMPVISFHAHIDLHLWLVVVKCDGCF